MENRTHVECSCTHLSTFAVLMDEGEVSVLEENFLLKVICLSIVSLSILLCFLSVLIFACLSEVRSAQAHLHNALALSLIGTYKCTRISESLISVKNVSFGNKLFSSGDVEM